MTEKENGTTTGRKARAKLRHLMAQSLCRLVEALEGECLRAEEAMVPPSDIGCVTGDRFGNGS